MSDESPGNSPSDSGGEDDDGDAQDPPSSTNPDDDLSEPSPVETTLTQVVDSLRSPWGLDFLPDGRGLVTERVGQMRIFSLEGELSAPIDGVPEVYAQQQGGLLDVLVGPTYEDDGYIYFCYATSNEAGSGTTVARARLSETQLEDLDVLFEATKVREPDGVHYGCRLAFHADGHLFIGLGERFVYQRAQDPGDHLGAVVRIQPDGQIPSDNPFVDSDSAQPEIWSYGHRNIQGMAVHPTTGEIWNHEHGPRGGDEVNIPQRGANFGWPLASYGSHYDGEDIPDDHQGQGFEEPIHYWTPSIAPSGMMFYQGELFPEWQGHLFVGALRGRHMTRLELDGDEVVSETRMLESEEHRIREISEGPDGAIYLLVDDAQNGQILRLGREGL